MSLGRSDRALADFRARLTRLTDGDPSVARHLRKSHIIVDVIHDAIHDALNYKEGLLLLDRCIETIADPALRDYVTEIS